MAKAVFFAALTILVIGALYYWTFRSLSGVTVTSWWRLPWHNAEVGGKLFSLHQLGLAWDLYPDGPVTQAQVIATGLPAKIVSEGDHLHVQLI